MTIREILQRLEHVTGPDANGEYMARCPCHDDKTASLSIAEKIKNKDGKQRIYLCCHAGCANSQIMAALGVTPRDLIVDPDAPGENRRLNDPHAPAGVNVYPAKEIPPQERRERPPGRQTAKNLPPAAV